MKKTMDRIKSRKVNITTAIDGFVLDELGRYAKGFGCPRAELIRRILREYLTEVKHSVWCDSRTLDRISEDIEFVLEGLHRDFIVQILEGLLEKRK